MPLIDFAFKTTLPISIAAIICMAIAHFFWQRYLDKRAHFHEMLDVNDITTTAPALYAILPFTPIIGVLIFDGKWGRSCTLSPSSLAACCWRRSSSSCAVSTPKRL